jgi:hypothetical protein
MVDGVLHRIDRCDGLLATRHLPGDGAAAAPGDPLPAVPRIEIKV